MRCVGEPRVRLMDEVEIVDDVLSAGEMDPLRAIATETGEARQWGSRTGAHSGEVVQPTESVDIVGTR
jgi:hypothetical protein